MEPVPRPTNNYEKNSFGIYLEIPGRDSGKGFKTVHDYLTSFYSSENKGKLWSAPTVYNPDREGSRPMWVHKLYLDNLVNGDINIFNLGARADTSESNMRIGPGRDIQQYWIGFKFGDKPEKRRVTQVDSGKTMKERNEFYRNLVMQINKPELIDYYSQLLNT